MDRRFAFGIGLAVLIFSSALVRPASAQVAQPLQPATRPQVVVAPSRPVVSQPAIPIPVRPIVPPLTGWVDLHTHPLVNLGFGGKLIHGGVDEQSLLPANHSCQPWLPAGSAIEALGDDRPTHGGWDVSFPCGNNLRNDLIYGLEAANHALITAGPGKAPTFGLFTLPGMPAFVTWPAWNDITHQKMWWEWIRRARDGGQRVMVALATNNRTLAEAATVGLPDGGPQDDVASANVQIREIKNFVARHRDFMDIALDSASLESIVRSNRIAVVLGVEIDNIGNFNQLPPGALNPALIAGEIQRLYDDGVRYVLPIHVVDNVFGATAIYEPIFEAAELRETGHYWNVVCARPPQGPSQPGDEIAFQLNTYPASMQWLLNPLKLGFVPPPSPQIQASCPGHRNGGNQSFPGAPALTYWGAIAVKELMRRGMFVDIDHMSTDAVDAVLAIAEAVPQGGYPIFSGHSGVRGFGGMDAENSRSRAQLARIANLRGMFGLGTNGALSVGWLAGYHAAMLAMGYGSPVYESGMIGFGTDLNGLVLAPPAPPDHNAINYTNGSFPLPRSARKPASSPLPIGPPFEWDYNFDGVAHYGMLPEFIWDVRRLPLQPSGVTGAQVVDNELNRSADHFWHTWQRMEAQRLKVQ